MRRSRYLGVDSRAIDISTVERTESDTLLTNPTSIASADRDLATR